jgi:hypothetical protein
VLLILSINEVFEHSEGLLSDYRVNDGSAIENRHSTGLQVITRVHGLGQVSKYHLMALFVRMD